VDIQEGRGKLGASYLERVTRLFNGQKDRLDTASTVRGKKGALRKR